MTDHVAPSPYSGLTGGDLADLLGDLDARIEPLLLERTVARAEMTRRRKSKLRGLRWIVDRTVKSPFEVDVEAIQARMGETWISAFRKRGWRVAFTITPREARPEDAA